MSTYPANDDETSLERAAQQALELRDTLSDLSDPALSSLIDLILLEIGIKLAKRLRQCS